VSCEIHTSHCVTGAMKNEERSLHPAQPVVLGLTHSLSLFFPQPFLSLRLPFRGERLLVPCRGAGDDGTRRESLAIAAQSRLSIRLLYWALASPCRTLIVIRELGGTKAQPSPLRWNMEYGRRAR
jgi:hypothetical protein